MAFQDKKFLDAEGITHLVKLLDEYPNNQILGTVIDTIEGELDQKAEKSEIPEVPVQDVQINGTSILQNGTANIPLGSGLNSMINPLTNIPTIIVSGAGAKRIKTGTDSFFPITPNHQHDSTFFGLSKAAGIDLANEDVIVGTYPNSAKTAIQTMLDVPSNAAMTTAIGNAIGNVNSFDMAVVQALPIEDISTHTIYLVPKTGETNDVYDEYVYINNAWEMVGNTQIDLSNYVQKTDYATVDNAGVVKIDTNKGLSITNLGNISIVPAPSLYIKAGNNQYNPIAPKRQHESTFYGLAKAAGDTTQSQSDNAVGTYTDEAKAAIQQMLDVPSTSDIPDTSIYATKADTVLETTLSRGRVVDSKIGENSFAFGDTVIAAGKNSCAQGMYTMAVGDRSRAEGYGDLLKSRLTGEANSTSYISTRFLPIGAVCYSLSNTNNYVRIIDSQDNDGIYTIVLSETLDAINPLDNKNVAFFFNVAFAPNSHTEGANSIALSANQHVEGKNNVPLTGKLQIIGNGLTAFSSGRSNAYALDEDGTGHYMGDIYVGANADSSGGTKVATVAELATKLDAAEAGLKVVRLI